MAHTKVKGKNALIFAFHVGKSGLLRFFTWRKSKISPIFGFRKQMALLEISDRLNL